MLLVSFGKKCVFLRMEVIPAVLYYSRSAKAFLYRFDGRLFAFYLNVRDNARISPFLQRADAYFQAFGCFPVA